MIKPDIRKVLEEKVLVLDGAMGTMIQRYKFSEADFRGEQFKDWSRLPQRQQRFALPHQAGCHPQNTH